VSNRRRDTLARLGLEDAALIAPDDDGRRTAAIDERPMDGRDKDVLALLAVTMAETPAIGHRPD
jgi:hypothetical protein